MVMTYLPMDEQLAAAAVLQLGEERTPIEFQFPPRIPSDSRKGSWDEGEMRGYEPIAVFKTSGPREITLNWTYIVDGGRWTTERIAGNIRAIRGYFARVRNGNTQRNLVVFFKLWLFGGKPWSFRIKSIDVKHSESIVMPCESGTADLDKAYPLRTDVAVELRLWTQGKADEGKGDVVQELLGLKGHEPVEWY